MRPLGPAAPPLAAAWPSVFALAWWRPAGRLPGPDRVAARPRRHRRATGAVQPAEERRRDAAGLGRVVLAAVRRPRVRPRPPASLALAGDAHGAMATLPPSLTRLVTQLHATDAAIDAALGEAATMAYMAKRDERLTRERSVRNDEKRAEVRALQTRVRVMWGSMHSELSASEAADAELRQSHATAAIIRKQHRRRLVERGTRAEHSDWMKRRLRRPADAPPPPPPQPPPPPPRPPQGAMGAPGGAASEAAGGGAEEEGAEDDGDDAAASWEDTAQEQLRMVAEGELPPSTIRRASPRSSSCASASARRTRTRYSSW